MPFFPGLTSLPAPLPACSILILSLQHHWEREVQPVPLSSYPTLFFPHTFPLIQYESEASGNTFSGAMDLLLLLLVMLVSPLFLLFLKHTFLEAAPPCCPPSIWMELAMCSMGQPWLLLTEAAPQPPL